MHRLYEEACSRLQKLCPRPTPLHLREQGVLLANLREIDEQLAASLASVDQDTIASALTGLEEFFASRVSDRCHVCGRKTEGMAELWSYMIEGSQGLAVFEDLVPLCDRCLEALRPEALSPRRLGKTAKWLAKVNGTDKGEVEELLDRVLEEWRAASRVSEWSVDLSRLGELGVDHEPLERLLGGAAAGRYSLAEGTVSAINYALDTIRVMVLDDVDALCSRRVDASILAARAQRRGLSPDWTALHTHIDLLLDWGLCIRGPEEAAWALEAAWVVHLPRGQRAQLVPRLIEALGRGETWAIRVETPRQPSDPAPVAVYTPSFVDVDLAARGAEELAAILHSMGAAPRQLRLYPRDPVSGRLARYHLYSVAIL
ncbi:hypothetical protein Pyrde_0840 [Pyrodictium delaneyi]|uniref:Uncharacterized protein n=1 Tax=Pyrodictium delaneyi TaxID=1273541 RepID=A0A0P0N438_9CREN|nr:hypothetical protein [Pyrodictium delaneyi]ALL00890.1 hypothetical protein Pyrde_0840 [Pyrodictium delaneyi]OWJ55489.1 hypothetical protein Pdsh_01450 [Pyrodictium delaneyi]